MNHLTDTEAQQVRLRLITSCDDMAAALQELLTAKKNISGQIHSLRKLGKTLRGGLVLLDLEKTAYREIQSVGRLLSERRDAVSRRSTWGKIPKKTRNNTTRAITSLLNQQVVSAGRKPPKATVLWCLDRVTQAKEAITEIEETLLADRIQQGLEKLRKKLRKRAGKLERPKEEAFHDLRKSIKAYTGAVKFLPTGAVKFLPERDSIIPPVIHELADILGDENDLATLSEWLASHGFTALLEPALWKKLKKSREKLQDQVIQQANHLQLDGAPEAGL